MLYHVCGSLTVKGGTWSAPSIGTVNDEPKTIKVPAFYIEHDGGIDAAMDAAKNLLNLAGNPNITANLCITTLYENNGDQLSIKKLAPVRRRHGGENRDRG